MTTEKNAIHCNRCNCTPCKCRDSREGTFANGMRVRIEGDKAIAVGDEWFICKPVWGKPQSELASFVKFVTNCIVALVVAFVIGVCIAITWSTAWILTSRILSCH